MPLEPVNAGPAPAPAGPATGPAAAPPMAPRMAPATATESVWRRVDRICGLVFWLTILGIGVITPFSILIYGLFL